MISYSRSLSCLALALLLIFSSCLHGQEDFKSLVAKLADDAYAVRITAKKDLVVMCRHNPKLIDELARVVFDEQEDVERVLNAREVVADAIFVERGAIGITLDGHLIVARVEPNGPAQAAGIQLDWNLLSVAGKSVEGKSPDEVYTMVHSTPPGSVIALEFLNLERKKVVCLTKVVARSTIRSDENPTERKRQLYDEWVEKMRKELKIQAD